MNRTLSEGKNSASSVLLEKAQMELAESKLRDDISRLGFDSYAVNLNTLTKTIEIVTSDPTKNEQVRALTSNHTSENI